MSQISRPKLSSAVQQMASTPASAFKGRKFAFHTAAGSLDPDDDLAICDATAGAFELALPSVTSAYLGVEYAIKETSGTAAVTLTTPDSETIDGANTLVVPAGGSATIVMSENSSGTRSWHSIARTQLAGTFTGTGAVDLSAATVTYPSAQITPAALLATVVAPAADAAAAILNTTTHITVSTASGANTAISTTSSVSGQVITLQMTAASGGGSYTLAVTGGTLTLNAANEVATIKRVSSAWVVTSLVGATIV